MPADAWVIHDRFKEFKGDSTIDMDGDTFELRLYSSTSNIADTSIGDATTVTNELTGNGYSPFILTTTWTRVNGVVTFDSDTPVYSAVGGSLVVRYAAVVDTSTAPHEVVAHSLLDNTLGGQDITITDGNTLSINMGVSGIFTEE
jgi:hypothetical protein